MGELRPDNGGSPPEDGRGGVPDLPPEWGSVVIPDDASELDTEAHALRRELRRHARRARLRIALHLPPSRRPDALARPQTGVSIVIILVAVLTTLVSLFIVTLGPGPDQQPPSTRTHTSATTPGATTAPSPASPAGVTTPTVSMPATATTPPGR
jgi:hypothetical protein